jgi:predicted RNase H-like HicB family nuclease
MVIDLITYSTDDGYTCDVPSIKGCESWAHTEDEVIEKTMEMVKFYLKLPDLGKILIDKARKEENKTVYKIIFDK